MSRDTILVTGGTGLIGADVIARLLCENTTSRIVALVRDRARWQRLADTLGVVRHRVTPLFGDVRCGGLGIDERARDTLARDVTSVVHLAADTSFTQTLPHARDVNVEGTRNVLELATTWTHDVRFLYVSTAFVAGRRTGHITETDAPAAAWVNAYEQSKHEAEALVRASGLPWIIARPSTVVCDRRNGSVTQRNAIHRAFALLHRGLAPMLPGNESTPVDFVTTEFVARGIVALHGAPTALGGTFHLCAGPGASTLGEVFTLSFDCWSRDAQWRARGIARPAFTDLETYALFEHAIDDVAAPSLKRIARTLSYFVPQLAYPKRFDTTNAVRLTGLAADPVRDIWPGVAADLARKAA